MKTILCPMDFSEVAANGLEYAAQLARLFSASITLVYVRPTIWPEAIQLAHEAMESTEAISDQLQRMCDETRKEYSIACRYKLDITTGTLEQAIATHAEHYDLIIMGTNGAHDYYEYVFGSNAFHVIEKTKCPVMIVPLGCSFKLPRKIVYAFDPDTNPIFLIDQLERLIVPLKAEVCVLHIAKEQESEKRKLEIMRDAVQARAPRNIKWSFDFKYSTDVAWELNQYMNSHHGDVLALSCHHRSLLDKLFAKNVVKRMATITDFPVFIFWH